MDVILHGQIIDKEGVSKLGVSNSFVQRKACEGERNGETKESQRGRVRSSRTDCDLLETAAATELLGHI